MIRQPGSSGSRRPRTARSIAVILAVAISGLVSASEALGAVSPAPIKTGGTGPAGPAGRVYVVARGNGRIYIGGVFPTAVKLDGSAVARQGLIALFADTGDLDPGFDAHLGSTSEVWSIALSADGTKLFVGGKFTAIGGGSARDLAAIDPTTGNAVPNWKADADGLVMSLAVGNGLLYAGGRFGNVTDASGGHARQHLVAVDPDNGNVDTGWTAGVAPGLAPAEVRAMTFSSDGRLFIGGEFATINGQSGGKWAALDVDSGRVTLRPGSNNISSREVFALTTDGNGLYVSAGGGGGQGTAFDATTAAQRWTIHGDGNFQGVAVLDGLVYFGGHFVCISTSTSPCIGNPPTGGVERRKIVAVNAASGALDSFAPAVSDPLGIFAILAAGDRIDIAGDFATVAACTACTKVDHPHFAEMLAPAPSAPGAPTIVSATPGNTSATVNWAPSANGGSAASYTIAASDGATTVTSRPVSAPATSAAVTGLANGTAYTFTVTATNVAGSATSAPSGSVTPRTFPGPPTGVSASPGDTVAVVAWSAPADNGGSAVMSYTVTAYVGATAAKTSTFAAPAASATMTGLTNGTDYTFTVVATNAAGPGIASSPAASATPSALAIPTTPGSPGLLGLPPDSRSGYWLVGADGRVTPFGSALFLGDPRALLGTVQAVDVESTRSGNGYWVVDELGRVYAYGDAVRPLNGNASGLLAGERVTSLSATRSGNGYWIFTSRGRVLTFGDATFHGDMSAAALNRPVVDSIPMPSGNGYYMVASDGGIFSFGDAVYYGSMGGTRLNAPVQSLVPDPDGVGYWLVAADGGVFAFDAGFRGSMGNSSLNKPITGMVPFGNAYLMVGEDGGIFNFATDRDFLGGFGANPPARPIVSVTALQG